MAFIVKRDVIAAPTTLPLSTPNIYISGLTFTDSNPDYRGAFLDNIYYRQSNTMWSNNGFLLYGSVWYLYAGCEAYNSEDGWYNAAVLVARNLSAGTAIPLTGWTLDQSIFTVAGAVVISATP